MAEHVWREQPSARGIRQEIQGGYYVFASKHGWTRVGDARTRKGKMQVRLLSSEMWVEVDADDKFKVEFVGLGRR
jgi:hypothetical protein